MELFIEQNKWTYKFVDETTPPEITVTPLGYEANPSKMGRKIEVVIPLTQDVIAQLKEYKVMGDGDCYEAIGKMYKDNETGKWCPFVNKHHEEATIASGEWEVKTIYVKKEK